jgi:hypothetical protein
VPVHTSPTNPSPDGSSAHAHNSSSAATDHDCRYPNTSTDANVVDQRSNARKNLAHFRPDLTVFAELKRRTHEIPRGAAGFNLRPGHRFAIMLISIGFGSNVSMCDMTPFRNRKITRFAFGAKCGALGVKRPCTNRLGV